MQFLFSSVFLINLQPTVCRTCSKDYLKCHPPHPLADLPDHSALSHCFSLALSFLEPVMSCASSPVRLSLEGIFQCLHIVGPNKCLLSDSASNPFSSSILTSASFSGPTSLVLILHQFNSPFLDQELKKNPLGQANSLFSLVHSVTDTTSV